MSPAYWGRFGAVAQEMTSRGHGLDAFRSRTSLRATFLTSPGLWIGLALAAVSWRSGPASPISRPI